ncbi:MAG TPA: hypothetical protein VE687_10995 [Stellaceae bacterium]|nr:hypothetical protein [Stellaceae bacterium]
MSRVSTLAVAAATGAITERFSRIKKTAGGFPNVEAAIEALEPATLSPILVVASGGGADDGLHRLGILLA